MYLGPAETERPTPASRRPVRKDVLQIILEIDKRDFALTVGRPPVDEEEFIDWLNYCKKGVLAQIDWDIVLNYAQRELRKITDGTFF